MRTGMRSRAQRKADRTRRKHEHRLEQDSLVGCVNVRVRFLSEVLEEMLSPGVLLQMGGAGLPSL